MSTLLRAAPALSPASTPLGQYDPEILMLAPEAGEESITYSLVAQMLELGLAIELDENWRLPTAPTRPLSKYKTLLFPDTAKEKYDAAVDDFVAAGGFMMYLKYFPTSSVPLYQMDHSVNLVEFNGRDVFTCHTAHMMLQSGAQPRHPQFTRALQNRPLASILNDIKIFAATRYDDALGKNEWTHWKDPDAFFLRVTFDAANGSGDAQWQAKMREVLHLVARSSSYLCRTDINISSRMKGQVEPYLLLFSWLLIGTGTELNDRTLIDAGVRVGRFWYDHNVASASTSGCNIKGHGGEEVAGFPAMAWLAKQTGDQKYVQFINHILDRFATACHRPDGLWSHWVDAFGNAHSSWCRANYWAVWGLAHALEALDPKSPTFARVQRELHDTYAGLAKHQDPETGLWRLVTDETFTRIETSGTCGFVYCFDRLHAKGLIDAKFKPMIDRAFVGLKAMCYRQGISAFCRGTDYVSAMAYRSRPLGFAPSSSFWPGVVGQRALQR